MKITYSFDGLTILEGTPKELVEYTKLSNEFMGKMEKSEKKRNLIITDFSGLLNNTIKEKDK